VTYPLDEFGGAEPDETPVVSRRRAVVILLSAVLVAVLVGLVAVVELRGSGGGPKRTGAQDPPAAAPIAPIGASASAPGEPAGPSTAPTAGPTPTGTHKVTPPPTRPGAPAGGPGAPAPPGPVPAPTGSCTAACEMPGDGTVPVGGPDPKAVRAGTYHSEGPTRADGCLWWLATDPQGDDQKAGRTVDHATDVIVKDGMWFHSEGCQSWRLVGPV
jgi:hypothetical protein